MGLAQITLVKDDMFFILPSANISLNFMDLGPQSVDLEKLSNLDYQVLRQAILRKEVISDVQLEARGQVVATRPLSSPLACQSVVASPSLTTMTVESKLPLEPSQKRVQIVPTPSTRERQQILVKMLQGNVRSIKQQVYQVKDLRDLQFLLDAERRGKKRKAIIKELGQLIATFHHDVASAIDNEDSTPAMHVPVEYKIGTAFEVQEDDVQEVEIKFPEFNTPEK